MVEIWRNVLKETDKKEARRKDFRLPVIIPCVLYNGTNNWTAKKSFKETLFKFEQFGEFVLDFKYILIDIRRYKDEELLELANLIATIFFIDKTKDKSTDLLNRLREVAEKMQGLSSEDLNIMWNWIKNIVARGSNAKFEKDIDDIFQKEGKVENMVYAIERVIEKEKLDAKIEGIAKTAIRLLIKKFGDLPEGIRDKIIELDEDALNTIIDEIFDYESLEELNELLVQ